MVTIALLVIELVILGCIYESRLRKERDAQRETNVTLGAVLRENSDLVHELTRVRAAAAFVQNERDAARKLIALGENDRNKARRAKSLIEQLNNVFADQPLKDSK